MGIGRDIEAADQKLLIYKGGVNIDEMEEAREEKRKGESENFLRSLYDRMIEDEQNDSQKNRKQISQVFKQVSRKKTAQYINLSKQGCAPPPGRYKANFDLVNPKSSWSLDYQNFHRDSPHKRQEMEEFEVCQKF